MILGHLSILTSPVRSSLLRWHCERKLKQFQEKNSKFLIFQRGRSDVVRVTWSLLSALVALHVFSVPQGVTFLSFGPEENCYSEVPESKIVEPKDPSVGQ